MMSYDEHSQLQCALEERASSYINTLAEAFYGPMDELSAKVFQLDLLDGIDDYEIQGRRFAELKVQELKNKWVIALRGVPTETQACSQTWMMQWQSCYCGA